MKMLKAWMLTFATLAPLIACGSHKSSQNTPPPAKETTIGLLGEEDALNDAVNPPPEYYDALTGLNANIGGGNQVLWVNFAGGTVTRGYGRDQSFILCKASATIPESGFDASDRDYILQKIGANYAAANAGLVLTQNRPTGGDYTTIHVGGTYGSLGCGGGPLGIAPYDTGNHQRNDVGFVFSGLGYSRDVIAEAISHEAGHTFGLQHVSNYTDIMYYRENPSMTGFLASREQNEPALLQAAIGYGQAVIR